MCNQQLFYSKPICLYLSRRRCNKVYPKEFKQLLICRKVYLPYYGINKTIQIHISKNRLTIFLRNQKINRLLLVINYINTLYLQIEKKMYRAQVWMMLIINSTSSCCELIFVPELNRPNSYLNSGTEKVPQPLLHIYITSMLFMYRYIFIYTNKGSVG